MELDVCPLPFNESVAATIDGHLGEITRFHETFRVYAHAVGPDTATLPADFTDRLIELQIGAVRVSCLAPINLAYSKLAVGREKDVEFVVALLHHKIVRQAELQRLIVASRPELKATMEARLQIVLAKLAQRREMIREQRSDRPYSFATVLVGFEPNQLGEFFTSDLHILIHHLRL